MRWTISGLATSEFLEFALQSIDDSDLFSFSIEGHFARSCETMASSARIKPSSLLGMSFSESVEVAQCMEVEIPLESMARHDVYNAQRQGAPTTVLLVLHS